MLTKHSTNRSALVTSNKERRGTKFGKPVVHNRGSNREGQWCTYCQKPWHTRETCFKLHRKEAVLGRIGGFKNMKPQGYISNKDPKEVAHKGDIAEAGSTQLNPEELSKLKAFLWTFQDGASCSLVQQGKSLTSGIFSAPKFDRNNMWILIQEPLTI